MAAAAQERDYEYRWLEILPFFSVHVLAVAGIIYYGCSWSGFALTVSVYAVLMFEITGLLHRYFAHRSYKTSRPFQFLMAVLCTCCTQKGVLWWAAHHRHHHKYSDQPDDTHSPIQRGFWWSHLGWILSNKNSEIRWEYIKDLAKYPELVWLQKHEMKVVVAFATSMFFVPQLFGASGAWGLLWGFFVMTVLLWHCTFTINSFTHLWGRRRYKTTDHSRNSLFFALLTHGEGWHNNHHYYQRCASQGFYWWEIDVSYYTLKLLSFVGLVSDVNRPPKHIRDARPTDVDLPAPIDAANATETEPERLHRAA